MHAAPVAPLPDPRPWFTPGRMRLAALALLAAPTAIFLLLAVGELAGGDISGVQHIPEATLLIGFMVIAWRHPRGAGLALLALGSLFLVFGLALNLGRGRPDVDTTTIIAWTVMAAALFLGPLLAGALLLLSSRPPRR